MPGATFSTKQSGNDMKIEVNGNGFLVDKVWSDAEVSVMQAEMDSWKSFRYHNVVITDAAGKTVKSGGTNDPHVVLPGLDHFGFPQDLTGKTVLDVGCNSGFYSMVAKLRGASRVMGVDVSSLYTDQASWLRDVLGFSPEEMTFQAMDGAALEAMQEQFDVVINLGVIYHIENPMNYLRSVASVTRGMMLLESEMLLDPVVSEYAWFIEKEYGCDPTNWWIYGPKCLEGMARAAGFSRVQFNGFLWRPEPGTKTPDGFQRQGRGVLSCWK
ncbi:MAG: DUF1698 domain-containing protein [Kiritimatiellae bacterium]|nr:DUF1698 domain-containing protein [Kiritimatiellia bacterium]MDD4734732.1 DUF1698 domain-containing protein [Kiritimatiellia bacterium]